MRFLPEPGAMYTIDDFEVGLVISVVNGTGVRSTTYLWGRFCRGRLGREWITNISVVDELTNNIQINVCNAFYCTDDGVKTGELR